MIHHPNDQFIIDFVTGSMPAQLSTMLSAHIETCTHCHSKYKNYLEEFSSIKPKSIDFTKTELDSSFDFIMSKVSEFEPRTVIEDDAPVNINISGQVIELPRSMSFLKDQTLAWKEFGKRNAIAPIAQGPSGNFYLIYIGPGEQVPHHDHSLSEYSYVVAGSYEDGRSSFETGDFTVSRKGYSHSPRATSEDGCLVLSWVEGRLNYFNGILSPLNTILWWYLHRA